MSDGALMNAAESLAMSDAHGCSASTAAAAVVRMADTAAHAAAAAAAASAAVSAVDSDPTELDAGMAGTSGVPLDRRGLLPPAEPGPAPDCGALFTGRAASTATLAASGESRPVRVSDRSSDSGSDSAIPSAPRSSAASAAAAAAAGDVDAAPAAGVLTLAVAGSSSGHACAD